MDSSERQSDDPSGIGSISKTAAWDWNRRDPPGLALTSIGTIVYLLRRIRKAEGGRLKLEGQRGKTEDGRRKHFKESRLACAGRCLI
jgi:hypothetical protein